MDTNFGYISGTFRTNTDIVNRATEGILPEHWFLRPGDASNHLMWVAGHLVASRGTVLKTLGSEWSDPWNSLFARGAKLAPPDQYPGSEEIRRAWKDVSEQLSASLASVPADLLAKPVPEGRRSFDGTVGGLVAFLAFHETYHVGQVSYLRKWLGYGQTVG
jgi:uncharacterized damage-inducible protein DinB